MAIKKRVDFYNSEEGMHAKEALLGMVDDPAYNTLPTYTANNSLFPDNLIPFVKKHMDYLNTHPSVEPSSYLSNLRLLTRIRH